MIQTNGSDNSFSVSACCLRYDIRAYDILDLFCTIYVTLFLKEFFFVQYLIIRFTYAEEMLGI